MKKLQKNEIGITLVALVVTIIILLILAGISIATLTGSGLFENTRLAEQKSKNAQELEDSILKDYENKIGSYINSNREQIMVDKQEYENLVKSQEFQAGDTYTLSGLTCFTGFVTGSKKVLDFSICLPKNISEDVTDIEFSTRAFDIRSVDGGYLINTSSTSQSNADLASYFVVSNITENYITFQYTRSTEFSITNNTPIGVALYDLNIRFK